MTKRAMKLGLLALVGGSMLSWGGCLGTWFNALVQNIPGAILSEFLTDNDAIFDLFQDDFGTGTTYDDRNSDDPSREEP